VSDGNGARPVAGQGGWVIEPMVRVAPIRAQQTLAARLAGRFSRCTGSVAAANGC
jgi:hypothetical protein